MGQSDRIDRTGKLKYVEPKTVRLPEVKVDSESVLPYNKEITVSLTSLLDARLEYTGLVTGKQYVWAKAGSTIEVSEYDSEILLAKRIGGNSCCGGSKDGTPIFQITT